MKNDTNLNTSKKIRPPRKKWPFFVFIPTGLVSFIFVFLLVTMIVYINLNEDVKEKECPLIMDDFSSWMNDGFTAVYDYESALINYPNGQISKSIRDIREESSFYYLLGVSKNEVLFLNNNHSKSSIIATNWSFNNRRTLLSMNGKCSSGELANGKIAIENNDKLIIFDAETGKADCLSKPISSIYGSSIGAFAGEFKEKNEYYYAVIPHFKTVSFSKNSIDNTVADLIVKWNFYPARCRLMLDGTICCSFHRNHGRFLTGQLAVFLIRIDENGTVLSYQFAPIDSSYQDGNWAYDIRESFADSIILPS